MQGFWITDEGIVCEVRDNSFQMLQNGCLQAVCDYIFDIKCGKICFYDKGRETNGTLNIVNNRISWTSGMIWNRISYPVSLQLKFISNSLLCFICFNTNFCLFL